MNTITRTLRRRREAREFERVVSQASPAMRQELLAAATRTMYRHL